MSLLTKAIDAIMRDQGAMAGVGHAMNEFSIWVNKIQGFKEAIRGRPAPGEATMEEIAQEQTMLRSQSTERSTLTARTRPTAYR